MVVEGEGGREREAGDNILFKEVRYILAFFFFEIESVVILLTAACRVWSVQCLGIRKGDIVL